MGLWSLNLQKNRRKPSDKGPLARRIQGIHEELLPGSHPGPCQGKAWLSGLVFQAASANPDVKVVAVNDPSCLSVTWSTNGTIAMSERASSSLSMTTATRSSTMRFKLPFAGEPLVPTTSASQLKLDGPNSGSELVWQLVCVSNHLSFVHGRRQAVEKIITKKTDVDVVSTDCGSCRSRQYCRTTQADSLKDGCEAGHLCHQLFPLLFSLARVAKTTSKCYTHACRLQR